MSGFMLSVLCPCFFVFFDHGIKSDCKHFNNGMYVSGVANQARSAATSQATKMSSMQTATLHIPYGKWRKYIGSNIPEVEQRIEAEGLVIKAPIESTVNELGRLVELIGSTKSIVRVMRSLLHRLAGPDPLQEIYQPEETCWQIQHQGQRIGPFRGGQFISWQPTSPCGLPNDLKSHTPVVHTKSRVLLPMWLLLAHFDTPSFERAVLPGSDAPSVSKSPGSTTASYTSTPSSTLTGASTSTGGSASSGPLNSTSPQYLQQQQQAQAQPHSAPHNPYKQQAAADQHAVEEGHPGMQKITYPCNYDDGDEEMWAADLAMDPAAASALAQDVSSQIQELRSAPDFEAMVTAMELDQEELDATTQYIPEIMDYVVDHVLAGLLSLPGMAADTDMARPHSLVHLHFVVDTSFLCHPAGMRFLRVLQERFAPKAPETADGTAGRPSSASAYGFVVSTIVPRKVYGELDGLKAADGRGDVARYARVAMATLLNGFRARDGFLALQSRAEFVDACKESGEDHPDTDSSVVQCAAHIRNMFNRKQAAHTATEPATSSDEHGTPADASAADNSHNQTITEDQGVVRRVIVLSNDNGVCIMAEAEQILTARQSDLPPSANTAMLIKFLTQLAADGRVPDLAAISASVLEADKASAAQKQHGSSSGMHQQQPVQDVSGDHGQMEEDEPVVANNMHSHQQQQSQPNHGQLPDAGKQATSQFLPKEQLPVYQTAPAISYDEFDDDYGASGPQGGGFNRQQAGPYQPQDMAGRDFNQMNQASFNRHVQGFNQWSGVPNQRPAARTRSNNAHLSYDDYDDDYSYGPAEGVDARGGARSIHELMAGNQQGPRHAPYQLQYQQPSAGYVMQARGAGGNLAARTASLPAQSMDPSLLGAAQQQLGAQQRMQSVPAGMGAAALNDIADALRVNQSNPQYLAAAITRLAAMQLQQQHQQKSGSVVVQTPQFHQAVAQAAVSGQSGAASGIRVLQQAAQANPEQQPLNVQAQPVASVAGTVAMPTMAGASIQASDMASINAVLQHAQQNGMSMSELGHLQTHLYQNPGQAPVIAAALAQQREQMQRRASLDASAQPGTQQETGGSGAALHRQGSANTGQHVPHPATFFKPPQTQADLANDMQRAGSQGQLVMQSVQPNAAAHTQGAGEESSAKSKWLAYAQAHVPPQPYSAELFIAYAERMKAIGQPRQFTEAAVDEHIKLLQNLMLAYSHQNDQIWQDILQTHQKQQGQALTEDQVALLQKHVQASVLNQIDQLSQQQQQQQQVSAPRASEPASTSVPGQAGTPFQAAAAGSVHTVQGTDPLQAQAMQILLQQQQERQAAQQRQAVLARLEQQVKQQVLAESQQDSDDEYGYPTEQRSNPAARRPPAQQGGQAASAGLIRPQHAQHGAQPRLPGALRQQAGGMPGRGGRGGPAVSATAMLHEMHAQATGGMHIVHNPGNRS